MGLSEDRESIAERIKEKADIVQIIGECVDLKKSGVRYLGRCPFHSEKTPSFSVHGGQQFYHCFGCGESGDVISFMMKYHHLDFQAALGELARRYHIQLPDLRKSPREDQLAQEKEQLYAINKKCAEIFASFLHTAREAENARAYLKKRGVSSLLQKEYLLGYAPAVEMAGWNFLGGQLHSLDLEAAIKAGLLVKKENGGTYDRFRDRIVFPIMDISGRVCGFGGRITGEGQPKYLNSPESAVFSKSRLLLGLYQQKEAIRQKNLGIIVEGNFDLISLVGSECRNVVAPLGTALTREQLRLLKRFGESAILLFDGDEAGAKAAERAVPLFLAEQMAGKVALLPEGHDPDTFVREKGAAALETLLATAESLPEFLFERLVKRYGFDLDGKRKIAEELKPLAAAAGSSLQRSVFIAHFSEKLGLANEELSAILRGHIAQDSAVPASGKEERPPQATAPLAIAQRQLLEFMILHPHFFSALEDAGIREYLGGTIGEVIFLQYRKIRAASTESEPEELLASLPEGGERAFVARLLINAPEQSQDCDEEEERKQLHETISFLTKNRLQQRSALLLSQIREAEQRDDHQLLHELLAEQIDISRKIHGVTE